MPAATTAKRPPRRKKKAPPDALLPPAHDWRTTDEHEVEKRKIRAREERFFVRNVELSFPVHGTFEVVSGGSGLCYEVEVRDIPERRFSCSCVDFRRNGLGTCKHVEAVLLQTQAKLGKRRFREAAAGSPRIELTVEDDGLQLSGPRLRRFRSLRLLAGEDGRIAAEQAAEVITKLDKLRAGGREEIRVSREAREWLAARARAGEGVLLRRAYEQNVQSGVWPEHETSVPLFPYQREGMLHLAFTERALLADEMGLGKTIQGIAACALLHRLGKVQRVLIVTPASLKGEWEEQIARFTALPARLVFGGRHERLKAYRAPVFFTIVNYEQMISDSLDVNAVLQPDVVVLDEAQRIKNWGTKTAQAIKRLRSRYAFVLTGTPIENRIDELYSLMDFLDPRVLGPLFRFNREYYLLDEKGRPEGFRNLGRLHEQIRPFMLRRRKAEVETQLPERTDRWHFVRMDPLQRSEYAAHEEQVAKLAHAAARRPLSQKEKDRLMREMAMMRMICDTPFILDDQNRTCPKLDELTKILEEVRDNPDTKVIVFSEWERMLMLVREKCQELGLGHAWHTGRVPQQKRRAEIMAFKSSPECRVFLSTDSGATGLNLQNASVVINCDLPWNPAKLEQRIARAWRKHQTRPVMVINLVAEDTIEHRMIATLQAKQAVAGSVLDRAGDLDQIKIRGADSTLAARLRQMLSPELDKPASLPPPEPVVRDRPQEFANQVTAAVGPALVACEHRFPVDGEHSVLLAVVEGEARRWEPHLRSLHAGLYPPEQGDSLAPVHLEVIDRTTFEAIERLAAAGLLARSHRVCRPLTAGA